MGHLANLKRAGTRTKTVDDPGLNRLGLQAARAAAARLRLRARRWPPPEDPAVRAQVARLRTHGLVEVGELLSPEDLRAVRAVATELMDSPDQRRDVLAQGANQLEVIWRGDVDPERRRVLDRFFAHPHLRALAGAAAKAELEPGAGRCVVQRLTQHDGATDLQADIHVDTFHPTHKAWLYLTDVEAQDGPLVYYPGSHRLDRHALAAIHRESREANEGSRRVEGREVAARGLRAVELTRPANTLVVADTSGYHGRAQGAPPGTRLALQVELRPDPFRRPDRLAEDRSRATGDAGLPQ